MSSGNGPNSGPRIDSNDAFTRITGLSLTSLLFGILVFAFTCSWLSESRRDLIEAWRLEEREQMSVLLARLRRLSGPETALPWLVRRNLSRIRPAGCGKWAVGARMAQSRRTRPGRSVMQAFAPLRAWLPNQLQFQIFDSRGKRLAMPGASTTLVAMSERVLQGIIEIGAGKPIKPSIRRQSSSFFGLPSTLEHLARRPGTLQQIRGGQSFGWAGWWTLPAIASPAAHLLLLISAEPDPETILRRASLASSRRLLRGFYRLGEGTPPNSGLIQSTELSPGSFVWLESLRSPDPSYHRWISALEAARIAVFAAIVLILMTILRTLWFRGRARLSLTTLVTVAILGAILPIGLATVIQASRSVQSAVRHLSWKAHRRLEQRLDQIDRTFDSTMQRMESGLLSLRQRLAVLPDLPQMIPAAWVAHGSAVNAIYALDRSGKVLSSFRGCRDLTGDPVDLARALTYTLMPLLDARPLPPGTRPPTADLSWMKGLGRHLANNLGRLIELETMGYTQNCLISLMPSPQDPDDYRVFIAFVNRSSIRRAFIHRLRQGIPGISFGMIETGKGGPTSSIPDRLLRNADLLALSEQVHRLQQPLDRRLTLPGGETRLFTILPGRHLDNLLLVGATPFDPIRQEIDRILALIGFALLIVLLIAIGSARSWVGRLKLSLQSLADNLEAIDVRRFDLAPAAPDLEMSTLHRGVFEAAHTLSEVYSAVPVQQTLLFSGDLATPDFEIGGAYHSEAFLGGHLLEAMTFPDGRLLFAIGEIEGKPIPATLLVAKLKMAISFLGETAAEPHLILEAVARLLASPEFSGGRPDLLIGIAGPGKRIAMARTGRIHVLQFASTGTVSRIDTMVVESLAGALFLFTPGWEEVAGATADPDSVFVSGMAPLLTSVAAGMSENSPSALAEGLVKQSAVHSRDRSVLCLRRRSADG